MSFWRSCSQCGRTSLRLPVDGIFCSASCKQQRALANQEHNGLVRKVEATVVASRAQEKRIAKAVGGQVVIASGAIPGMKGDVRSRDWLIEAKTTAARSFSLTRGILDKILNEALTIRRKPALFLSISGEPWVVIPEHIFLSLIGEEDATADAEDE